MTARRRCSTGSPSEGLERLASLDPDDWVSAEERALLAELVTAWPDRADELYALGGDTWLMLTPPGWAVSDIVRADGLTRGTHNLAERRRREAVYAEADRRGIRRSDLAEQVGLG